MTHSCRLLLILLLTISACSETVEVGPWTAQAEQAIREALRSDSPALRAETLRLLGLTGDAYWTPLLREGLADPAPLVQAAALGILLERGDEHAERRAGQLLLSDSAEERSALLGLVAEYAGESEARQLIDRALRDASPDVALRAIQIAQDQEIPLQRSSLLPLRDARDPALASAAFEVLHRSDPDESLSWVIAEVRSGDEERMRAALSRLSTTRVPDLWPTLRSIARNEGTIRSAALPALGMLGDHTVSEALRSLLFTQNEAQAAQALFALAHIDDERTRSQPARLASDRRTLLRSAGLDAIIARGLPSDDLALFLHDPDERIAARALAALLERGDEDAHRILREQLALGEVRREILQGMYRHALLTHSWEHVGQSGELLMPLLTADDLAERDLARRLLLGDGVPREQVLRPGPAGDLDDYARYLIAELALRERTNVEGVYAWLESDLVLVRIAALLLLSEGRAREAAAEDGASG